MQHILFNSSKYEALARQFEFDKSKWDKNKEQCLFSLLMAIETFSKGQGYVFELNAKKSQPCININPDSYRGRVRGRTAGVYAVPTDGKIRIYFNQNTYDQLHIKYELPECEIKNGQPNCYLSFCELCSVIEAIISM